MSANDLVADGIPVKAAKVADRKNHGPQAWQQSRGLAAKSLKNKDFLLRRANPRRTIFPSRPVQQGDLPTP
jgi:hypothetical protein